MQVSFKRIKERKRILIENSRAGIAGVLKETEWRSVRESGLC